MPSLAAVRPLPASAPRRRVAAARVARAGVRAAPPAWARGRACVRAGAGGRDMRCPAPRGGAQSRGVGAHSSRRRYWRKNRETYLSERQTLGLLRRSPLDDLTRGRYYDMLQKSEDYRYPAKRLGGKPSVES